MTTSVVTKLLTGALSLTAQLTQDATNGLSQLGLVNTSTISDFLTDNPLPNGFPWGTDTALNTNYYETSPNTGVIRRYDFTIKRGLKAPDGYQKQVILINDQYPGPTIEANWGDTIQVTVHNQISTPEEGTALHWHGLLQKATPWYDGVPSVQQCPIAPGNSFTYSFKADLYGTSWYHSHYSAQYAGGLHGPMIIHGPKNVPYDIDIGPVFLSDWYHGEYFDVLKKVVGTDGPLTQPTPLAPNSDNNLINGKMDFDCSTVNDGVPCVSNAGLAKFKFQSGKSHRLRIINAGAEGIQKFSIDNHTMTVMANDFVPIKPYDTNIVTVGIGQRTDVIVKAIGKPTDAYWMRSDITACATANQPHALAVVYYEKANTTAKPTSQAYTDNTQPCENDDIAKTQPFYPITPDPNPATTKEIIISGGFNDTHHFNFYMNNQTFRANYNKPVLLLAQQGNTSFPKNPEWNVYNFGSNKTVRLVVYNHFPAAHPMHLHGHNMFVLAVSTNVGIINGGKPQTWDGKIVNAQNPQRRDVQMLPPFGYLVLQINMDNPGIWPFHCHIAWHVSQGLYINIMERPADIKQMQIPQIMQQTCTAWQKYTDDNPHPQNSEIDSGLKARNPRPIASEHISKHVGKRVKRGLSLGDDGVHEFHM
ncbi:MAG: hypothetical protein M1836_006491 [Candelina mexicana]|nr:MAG: hypothetical protein M1836_006491 [Candelina mexicana]